MNNINTLIRREVKGLQEFCPQLPDRTVGELKTILGCEHVIKLSFNESPYGPSPKAVAAIVGAARYANLYHDVQVKDLRKAVGRLYGFDKEHVFLGNGADEVITLLAQAFLAEGDEVIIPYPTFGQYAFAAKLMGAQPVLVPVNKDMTFDFSGMLHKINNRTKMIFVCNPNNPTGILTEKAELTAFIKKIPEDILIVLDEAYSEYVTHPEFISGIDMLPSYPNIITVRTFSKIYGLAGLRLGYGIASPQVVNVINRVRSPFNVNMLVQEAALAALADQDFRQKVADLNAEERANLTAALTKMGFKVFPSQTNFLFVDIGIDSQQLCDKLAKSGIIIRSAKDWNLPTCVRISLGDKRQNEALLNQMNNISLK